MFRYAAFNRCNVYQGGTKRRIVGQGTQLRQLTHEGVSRIQLEFIWGGQHVLLFKNQSK